MPFEADLRGWGWAGGDAYGIPASKGPTMKNWTRAAKRAGSMDGWLARRPGMIGSYFGSNLHRSGIEWTKGMLGAGLTPEMRALGINTWSRATGVMRLLGPAWIAYRAYEGFKEGGPGGAVKGAAFALGESYLFPHVAHMAGMAALGGAAMLGMQYGMTGAGPLETLTRPLVREHMRKHAKLEMGRPIHDQFGNVATMRQRSVMAIQNSKINGRSALGHEATLAYSPYFR